MKKAYFLIFFLLFGFTLTHAFDVTELRIMYYKATSDRSSADKFIKTMQNLQEDDKPILLCYKGMAYLIQAKFTFGPFNKLSYFNKGREMLERAIETVPENVEIRFMRFCVQTNAPFFLGYNNRIKIDKEFIINNFNSISDSDLKDKIRTYLLEYGNCTKEEKLFLK